MSEQPDRELVELARAGDRRALGELFSRYWRAARAAAFGVTGDVAAAEDAAAEAFRQALVGLDALRDPNRFGSWLRTIVVRTARLERHRRRPSVDASAGDLSDPNVQPDEALEQLELGALIHQAVRELPDRLREAMALVYFEGYDTDAAAGFLGVPAGTLRRRLHEGRVQLRDAVGHVLQGSRRMNEEREHRIEKVKSLIDNGEIYQAMRESLALRPTPPELIDLIGRRHPAASDSRAVTGSTTSLASLQEMAQRLLRPSDRASNPNHPVGSMAAAIRRALPDFQEWSIDAGKVAAHLLTYTGERRDRLMAVLPPGFAEGRPGSFLRATRAILHLRENGPVQSFYELLQASPDEETFRAAMNDIRISDVLDLTWMVAGPLELRSVQDLLERVTAAVLPGQPVRFSPYDEPRYRSALQLHSNDVSARLACGGVLAEWPGRPPDVDAGHLRIFLEPWATVRTGHAVEFDRIATRLGGP